jgi:hypothetical protein
MPLFFDGQPRMLLRLAVAAANGTIFQLQYGFAISVAIALGVLALMIGTEFWFGRARVWREWLEKWIDENPRSNRHQQRHRRDPHDRQRHAEHPQ